MKRVVGIFCVVMFALLVGCIENNVPYPYIELRILDIAVENQNSVRIDNESMTVTIDMHESADLSKVKVTKLSVTEGANCPIAVDSKLDLRAPYDVPLSLYQTFDWQIVATQNIERYFYVENQVGVCRIAPNSKKAVAMVPIGSNLKRVNVTGLKLGPEGATVTPDISTITDFSDPFNYPKVKVSYHGIEEEWELIVITTNVIVETKAVHPWAKIAWLQGQCREGMIGGFEYCLNDGQDNWVSLDPSMIEQNGNSFQAKLTGLTEQTSYKCRAFAGEEYGEIIEFETGAATPLPNGSFDIWWKDEKIWCPWIEGEANFWDTGNKGSSTLGDSNTIPADSEKWDSKDDGNGAKLMSKFVGIGTVGKFAAGNIYVGDFKQIDGTNGILDMGKPFSSFPTRLKGYYKYKTMPIDNVNDETEHMLGMPDTCSIYIVLGDWDEPVEIRTRPSNRKLFDKQDPHIIAYAEMYSAQSTDGYLPFTLELEYRELGRTPKYLLIVASASKYGDFFTGGDGATLWLDELCFEYD